MKGVERGGAGGDQASDATAEHEQELVDKC